MDVADGGVLRLHRRVSHHHDRVGTTGPRRRSQEGSLAIDTTRGDRLFISLVGSAFIFLAWLAIMGTPLWGPLVIAILCRVRLPLRLIGGCSI